MAVTRWDPFTAVARMDREFDELVRQAWGNGQTPQQREPMRPRGFVPAVDLVRSGNDVVIRLELPGIDVGKDVEIEVERGRLAIRGERRDEYADETTDLLVRELRYGAFLREFALPEGVTADNVEASYDQGILEVRLHNVVQREPEPQKIQIRGGTKKDVGTRTVEGEQS